MVCNYSVILRQIWDRKGVFCYTAFYFFSFFRISATAACSLWLGTDTADRYRKTRLVLHKSIWRHESECADYCCREMQETRPQCYLFQDHIRASGNEHNTTDDPVENWHQGLLHTFRQTLIDQIPSSSNELLLPQTGRILQVYVFNFTVKVSRYI